MPPRRRERFAGAWSAAVPCWPRANWSASVVCTTSYVSPAIVVSIVGDEKLKGEPIVPQNCDQALTHRPHVLGRPGVVVDPNLLWLEPLLQ